MMVHDAWGDESVALSMSVQSGAGTPQSPAVQALKSKLRPEMRGQSALDQLEAEMKLLQWHKLANEQALKAALIKTKNLRNKDRAASAKKRQGSDMELEEKVAWMQQIIEEEQSKPLQVSKDFVLQYEQREHERKEKLDNEIVRHVDNLKRIRQQMNEQLDLRQRHQTFRRWKVERAPIKKAIMEGKIVTNNSLSMSQLSGSSQHKASYYTQQSGLETVLQSLSKLEELEHRISALERNKAAKQVTINSGKAGTVKAEVKFARRRVDSLAGNPARAVYTVRLHQGMTNKVGTTVRRQPARQPIPKAGAHISAQKYLRSLPNLHAQEQQEAKRQAIRAHERHLKMSLTSGQSELRSRVKTKQQRQQQQQQERQRHRTAVQVMQERKAKPYVIRPRVNVPPKKGAASGRRHANQSMQEFEDIRRMHQRRREALNRQSTRTASNPTQPARQRTRKPPSMSQTAPRRTTRHNTSLSKSMTASRTSTSRDYPIVGPGVGGIRALRRR